MGKGVKHEEHWQNRLEGGREAQGRRICVITFVVRRTDIWISSCSRPPRSQTQDLHIPEWTVRNERKLSRCSQNLTEDRIVEE